MSFIPPIYIPIANKTTATSVTGTTAKTTLGTFVVKANTMGLNDVLGVYYMITVTNNANVKTIDVDFGATNFVSRPATALAGLATIKYIQNRNSLTSQISGRADNSVDYGTSATALTTMSENTATDITVTFSGTLANAADTLTLECLTPILFKFP